MRLLVASDLHRDLAAARGLVARSRDVDAVVIAGDLCSMHRGLAEIVGALSGITAPTVLVPGNAETDGELRAACAGWDAAHVLHGEGATIGGVPFFGLGGGVPVTPFGAWSFDLTEEEAAASLEACPRGGVLVTHSPPRGHCDRDAGGESHGSAAILECLERTGPMLAVCGHIHASWGTRSVAGATTVVNAGPAGIEVEVG